MNEDNINQQNNETGPTTPPPKEEINIRTMGSDRQSARQGVVIPFVSSTPEPEPKAEPEPKPEPSPMGEVVSTDKTPKAIPDWAKQKLEEEETTTESTRKKSITLTVIVLIIIIGFILIGYFVSSVLFFKH